MRPAGASVARRWYDGGHDDRGQHGAGAQGERRRITYPKSTSGLLSCCADRGSELIGGLRRAL